MFRVCESCGEWNDEIVVADDSAAVCTKCGHRHPLLRLPLFQITGASGTGKTRVGLDLPRALPDSVVLDQDITLAGLPWEQHRQNWLRIAANIHQGNRSVVFVATQLPEHYEPLPERAWFSDIHYLALVCDDATLAERLGRRPAWRGATHERIAEMQRFNRWLLANAASTVPPMTLLDTSDAEPPETVAAVAAWVRERLEPHARS